MSGNGATLLAALALLALLWIGQELQSIARQLRRMNDRAERLERQAGK